MRSRSTALLAVLLLAAAACGDDGGSPFTSAGGATTTAAASATGATTTSTTAATTTSSADQDQLVDALAAELVASGGPFDDEAARCFAEGALDALGLERLAALGLSGPGADTADIFSLLTEEELDAVADLGLSCLDVHALFVDEFVAQGLPQEVAACIADGVAGAPFLHDLVVAAMIGEEVDPMADPEAMELIVGVVTQCMGE